MQDDELLERAKRNRKALTPFEAKLWAEVSGSKLGGYKFRRQHVIERAIVDFFCPAKGLIIEVDGDTHDLVRDAARDRQHALLGYRTLRFTNQEVGRHLDGVLTTILQTLETTADRWPATRPHPHPSPEGEGR